MTIKFRKIPLYLLFNTILLTSSCWGMKGNLNEELEKEFKSRLTGERTEPEQKGKETSKKKKVEREKEKEEQENTKAKAPQPPQDSSAEPNSSPAPSSWPEARYKWDDGKTLLSEGKYEDALKILQTALSFNDWDDQEREGIHRDLATCCSRLKKHGLSNLTVDAGRVKQSRTNKSSQTERESLSPEEDFKNRLQDLKNDALLKGDNVTKAAAGIQRLKVLLGSTELKEDEKSQVFKIYVEACEKLGDHYLRSKKYQEAATLLEPFREPPLEDKHTQKCKANLESAEKKLSQQSNSTKPSPIKKQKGKAKKETSKGKGEKRKEKQSQKPKPVLFLDHTPSSSPSSSFAKEKEPAASSSSEKGQSSSASKASDQSTFDNSLRIEQILEEQKDTRDKAKNNSSIDSLPSSSGVSAACSHHDSTSEDPASDTESAKKGSWRMKDRNGSFRERREEEKTNRAIARRQSVASFFLGERNPEASDPKNLNFRRQSSVHRMLRQLSETWEKQGEEKKSATANPLIVSSDAIGRRIEELNDLQSKDPLAESFRRIYKSLEQDAREGEGKPKRLKSKLGKKNLYRRKLNDKDRVIYTITIPKEGGRAVVEILQIGGHYDD